MKTGQFSGNEIQKQNESRTVTTTVADSRNHTNDSGESMNGTDIFYRPSYCFLLVEGRSSARGKPSATIYVTVHSAPFSLSRRARFFTFLFDTAVL